MIMKDFVSVILYFLYKKCIKARKTSKNLLYRLLTFAMIFSIIVASETVACATILL